MKIPDIIKIGGHDVQIMQCEANAIAGEYMGLCDSFNKS